MTAEEIINALNEILNYTDAPCIVRFEGVEYPVVALAIERSGSSETVVFRTQ